MSEVVNQLKTVDLEPEENFENKQITRLRRLFEQDKEEKEKEKLINIKQKEKMKINIKIDENIYRKYVGKKINRDHNGEIIFIKSIKANSLKKEFIISNSKCKTISTNTISQPKNIEKNKEIKIEVIKDEEKEEKKKKGN